MDERLAEADSLDSIVAALVSQLEAWVEDEPAVQAVVYEMLSASRHSEEIRAELAELYRRWRAHLAEALREKESQGVVKLQGDAESVASILFALGDGLGIQLVSDPAWDSDKTFELGIRTARQLLGAAE
jgi:DNA-binding transcriptional MocR family regulator